MDVNSEKITLYALPISPYCSKVRIYFRLANISFKEEFPLGGTYTTTDYHQLIPAGSIPAIKQGDFLLHDSDAILEYLEDVFPDKGFRPSDPKSLAVQRSFSQFHNSRIEPAVRAFFPFIKNTEDIDQTHDVALCIDHLNDQLYRLEQMINPSPFLGGEKLCLADCAYPVTLHMAKLVIGHFNKTLMFADKIETWLSHLESNDIILDEINKHRISLNNWLIQYKPKVH